MSLSTDQARQLLTATAGTRALSVEHTRRGLLRTGNVLPLVWQLWPDVTLDTFQEDILRSMFRRGVREVYCKGCTSSGKTAAVGMGVATYFFAYPGSKVVLTSVSHAHAKAVLYAEVKRWLTCMSVKPPELTVLESRADAAEGRTLDVVNPLSGEGFSGRHGENVLFVFDEASGVPSSRFDLANTQASRFVALSNPRTMSGAFRTSFNLADDINRTQTCLGPYGHRRLITVDGAICLNVRKKRLAAPTGPIGGIRVAGRYYSQGESIPHELWKDRLQPIIPGQLAYDTFLAHCANPDARWVDCFARGKFAEEDPDTQLILNSWLKRHVDAWRADLPVTHFSVDPAASDSGDSTALAAGGVDGCREILTRRKADLMDTCGCVIRTVQDRYGINLCEGKHPVCIDCDGLGKGLFDRLRELGVRVIEFRGNGKVSSKMKDRVTNKRAEAYALLADRLRPDGKHSTPWALPNNELLQQDICAVEKWYDSDGFKFKVSPKHRQPGMPENRQTVSEKLGRSPDRGDACVYLCWCVFRPVATHLVA